MITATVKGAGTIIRGQRGLVVTKEIYIDLASSKRSEDLLGFEDQKTRRLVGLRVKEGSGYSPEEFWRILGSFK